MARPATKELTDRELEVMHIFWKHGEQTAQEARDRLETQGVERAYVTIANLVRILVEKGYLQAVNQERPFRYLPPDHSATFPRTLSGISYVESFMGLASRCWFTCCRPRS